MMLTDTHTHIYYETDTVKQQELIGRCVKNNVNRLFLPNVDAASIPLVFGFCKNFPGIAYPMLGLHPCDVKQNFEEELQIIKNTLQNHEVVAIGEIGIDLYWDKSTIDWQKTAFKRQISWAKELQLPIVIHCRDAFDEVYAILLEQADDKLRGIFHCFTGNLEQAQKIIDLNFYLGIGGVVTYKNSGLDKVVQQLPLKHLVLETDSPYLPPVPYRGKPNESSYLKIIAEKVADIKHLSLDELAEITTQNSKMIFGI